MSTLLRKKLFLFRAPLLFAGDRLSVGGSWEPYPYKGDMMNVYHVSETCLGHLDPSIVLHVHTDIIDQTIKHHLVVARYDYSDKAIQEYNEVIQNILEAHTYLITHLQHLQTHLR